MEYPSAANGEVELQTFNARLRHWQHVLSLANTSAIEPDVDTIADELNDLWPYAGEECHFSGVGVYPVFNPAIHDYDDVKGVIDSKTGTSQGLIVDAIEEENFQIYYVFYLDTVVETKYTRRQQSDLFAYITAESANIVPGESIEDIFKVPELEISSDIHKILDTSSKKFLDILQSRVFKRLTQLEQRRTLETFIRRVEDKTAIRGSLVTIEPEHILIPRLGDGMVQYDKHQVKDEYMKGVCQGLGSTEIETLHHEPIRRKNHLSQKAAGLCLVVQIEESSDEFVPEAPVLIPIWGQDMEVVIER